MELSRVVAFFLLAIGIVPAVNLTPLLTNVFGDMFSLQDLNLLDWCLGISLMFCALMILRKRKTED